MRRASAIAIGLAAMCVMCTRRAESPAPAVDAGAAPTEDASVVVDASVAAPSGPLELPLAPNRTVFYALPAAREGARVVAHIHGVCGGPEYACAKWVGAATEVGAMICPTGNVRCGGNGPASWEAPSWGELVAEMDRDVERSVARVLEKHPNAVRREGAVLTGFSRGAYAVPVIATMHPGRWPLLVVVEADAPMAPAQLRKAGVRAVALVAAENGAERAGMTKTAEALSRAGLPAKLFLMRKSSHLYSEDIEAIMRDALAFVLANDKGS